MLHSFSARIASRATLKSIFLLAILYACCLAAITWLIHKATGTIRFMELEPVWHPGELHEHFSGMMEHVHLVVKMMLLVDLMNIMVYTLMFSMLIAWFYRKRFPLDDHRIKLCMIPFVMAAFDIAENVLIYSLLSNGDMRTATLLNIMILAKLVAGALCGLVIAYAMLLTMKRKR